MTKRRSARPMRIEGWEAAETVAELQARGVLRVEDGNHGEYRPRRNEFSPTGVAFVRAADVRDGGVDFSGADKINQAAMSRIRKGVGEPGDFLLTHKGTVGRLARVLLDAPEFVCSPQTTFWRVLDSEALDPDYLYAFLRSPAFAEQLRQRQHDTDMAPYVSLTTQRELRVPLPSIETQRAMGTVTRALDDKLDSNRRLAATLEETATALFRARFVDFVGVEEFDDSEIGPIPKGWKSGALSDVADFVNGKAFTKHANEKGRPILRIKELNSGIGDATPWSDIEAQDEHLARHHDILFAWSGSLDVYRWAGPEALINQHIFKVIPRGYPAWFVHGWIREHMASFQAIARDKATTMGHIQRRHLDEAKVALPDEKALAEIASALDPMDEEQGTLAAEMGTLELLRDALLPKLISGEIRVPAGSNADDVAGAEANADAAVAS